MATTQILTAVTEEQALVPGTIVELEYDLVTTDSWLIANYLRDMEPKLLKEEPLWQYLGYKWAPGDKRITFRMKLRQYQMDMNTREIIPLDPVTLEPVGETMTMYYASAGFIKAVLKLAALAVTVGGTWLIVREVRKIIVAPEETKQAILDSDLTPEQQAEALKVQAESTDQPSVIRDAAQAAAGTFAVMVALTLAYVILGRR